MQTLSTAEMANVYNRLQAGADPDAVRAEFPGSTPAPRGAGHPEDGHGDQTHPPGRPPAPA